MSNPVAPLNWLKLKIPPPVLMILCLVCMYWQAQTWPIIDFSGSGIAYLVVMWCIFGMLLDGFALWAFAQAKTSINPMHPEETSHFIQHSVYNLSRNPMYLGLLMYLFAGVCYFAALSNLLVVLLFVVYMDIFQIKPEEAVLTKLFPDEYPEYCQRVKRWWRFY
jgi:protein-S-isoprenylcysteine O-methyltransferase Ste14